MTEDEMKAQFVLLSVGGYVARRADGRVMAHGDLARELSASWTEIEQSGGKSKTTKAFDLWLGSADRVTVDTQTWAPHLPMFCSPPS